jgi:tRNA threonylcarbamoyladenosine biosynthesis protein TsaE
MVKFANLTLPQVQKLAEQIAKKTRLNGSVIGLSGNLGSGKTTFAKAFAKALGIKALKSPTFIVSQRYELGKKYLYHLDFYRLKDKKDLEAIGIEEILSSGDIALIEWVEKFPQIQHRCDMLITFIVKRNNKRDVAIQTN